MIALTTMKVKKMTVIVARPLERDDVDDLHDAGQKYANPH